MKKQKKLLLFIISIIILIYGIFNQNFNNTQIDFTDISDYPLSIHYLDVGQADCELIKYKNYAVLIDAGNNEDGDNIVKYLNNLNIKKLDYIIATHPHEDHIGGLDNVIKEFDVGKILMPKVQANTKTFEDVLDTISSKNLKISSPDVNDTFSLDELNFTVLSADNNNDELNLSSIVIKLNFQDCSYLFCGDAESENELNMLHSGNDITANVIKIGHHGSSSSSTEKFIFNVHPETAIISVGKNNKYGHPSKKTIETLTSQNIAVYRTDLNGTIIIASNGKDNKISTNK